MRHLLAQNATTIVMVEKLDGLFFFFLSKTSFSIYFHLKTHNKQS